MTLRATEIGLAIFCMASTAPQLPFLSIIQASKVTLPSLSGLPPVPTVWLVTSSSSTFTPCSIASKALPPSFSISQAFAEAFKKSQVHITIGYEPVVFVAVCKGCAFSLQDVKNGVATRAAVAVLEFFRNFLLSIVWVVYFWVLNIRDLKECNQELRVANCELPKPNYEKLFFWTLRCEHL